jgi:hypothetical protein
MTKYLYIPILFFILISFHTGVEGSEYSGPVDFTFEPVLSSDWGCYIEEGDLYIKNLKRGSIKVRAGKDSSGAIVSPVLTVHGDTIFVAWVERAGRDNTIRFTTIRYDGEDLSRKDITVTDNTKATQVNLFTDEKDRLFLIEAASGKTPELSLNLSLDGGKHFKKTNVKLDDLEALYNPTPLPVNDTLYLFYAGVKEDTMHIGLKSFKIPSMEPGESTVLKKTEGISFIEALKIGGTPLVIYKTMRENIFYLEGFLKEDDSWKATDIKGAHGLDVARMDHHVWDDGRILIVFSGEERGVFKQRIYAAVSEDGGRTWDVQRIDNKTFDNTRAWLPRMAVNGDNAVVVWEDSRNIRSGVWAKLSPDRGKTWLARDILISEKNAYAFRPRITFARKTFHIAWDQFKDDEKKVAYFALIEMTWDSLVNIASREEKALSLEKKEALLRERVKAYWEGMIKKDLKTPYETHDPFYKARIPFEYYASHRGPMVYLAYSIEDVIIQGNIATVKIKVTYEIPRITILGKDTSMPPKEVTAEDTYLFLDNTWYRKYVDAMSGGSAIDY